MPDTSTEVAIATTTLSSAASTITFSSISGSYTDLRLVLSGSATGNAGVSLRFNSDSATNYSQTVLYGQGSVGASSRATSGTGIDLTFVNNWNTPIVARYVDIFSYAGSTYKSLLANEISDLNGSGSIVNTVGLWRSTSAITRIDLTVSANNFAIGTTATLYGIL